MMTFEQRVVAARHLCGRRGVDPDAVHTCADGSTTSKLVIVMLEIIEFEQMQDAIAFGLGSPPGAKLAP